MACLTAGAALGPAIGGLIAYHAGISGMFYCVGGSFFVLMATSYFGLKETFYFPKQTQESQVPQLHSQQNHRFESAQSTPSPAPSQVGLVTQWRHLLSQPQIRNAIMMHGMVWGSLSASQMTLLPFLLSGSPTLLDSAALGGVYLWMTVVGTGTSQSLARITDSLGTRAAMALGASAMATGMFLAPLPQLLATHAPLLVAPLLGPGGEIPLSLVLGWTGLAVGTWAMGSAAFNAAVVSRIADLAGMQYRAQALALMRTVGDVGLAVGAGCAGWMAGAWSAGTGMQVTASALALATSWLLIRGLNLPALAKKWRTKTTDPQQM
jgi:hypothetical protein